MDWLLARTSFAWRSLAKGLDDLQALGPLRYALLLFGLLFNFGLAALLYQFAGLSWAVASIGLGLGAIMIDGAYVLWRDAGGGRSDAVDEAIDQLRRQGFLERFKERSGSFAIGVEMLFSGFNHQTLAALVVIGVVEPRLVPGGPAVIGYAPASEPHDKYYLSGLGRRVAQRLTTAQSGGNGGSRAGS